MADPKQSLMDLTKQVQDKLTGEHVKGIPNELTRFDTQKKPQTDRTSSSGPQARP